MTIVKSVSPEGDNAQISDSQVQEEASRDRPADGHRSPDTGLAGLIRELVAPTRGEPAREEALLNKLAKRLVSINRTISPNREELNEEKKALAYLFLIEYRTRYTTYIAFGEFLDGQLVKNFLGRYADFLRDLKLPVVNIRRHVDDLFTSEGGEFACDDGRVGLRRHLEEGRPSPHTRHAGDLAWRLCSIQVPILTRTMGSLEAEKLSLFITRILEAADGYISKELFDEILAARLRIPAADVVNVASSNICDLFRNIDTDLQKIVNGVMKSLYGMYRQKKFIGLCGDVHARRITPFSRDELKARWEAIEGRPPLGKGGFPKPKELAPFLQRLFKSADGCVLKTDLYSLLPDLLRLTRHSVISMPSFDDSQKDGVRRRSGMDHLPGPKNLQPEEWIDHEMLEKRACAFVRKTKGIELIIFYKIYYKESRPCALADDLGLSPQYIGRIRDRMRSAFALYVEDLGPVEQKAFVAILKGHLLEILKEEDGE